MEFDNEFFNQIKGASMGGISNQLMELCQWGILESNSVITCLISKIEIGF